MRRLSISKTSRMDRWKTIWVYGKYQLVVKGAIFLVILPLLSLLFRFAMGTAGRSNLTSGDFTGFIFSLQGVFMLPVLLAAMALMVGLDIHTFVLVADRIICGRMEEKKSIPGIRSMLWAGIRSTRRLFTPSGLLLLLYIGIVVPVIGVGFTVSPVKNFQIPNFIMDVVYHNTLYSGLYIVLVLAIILINIRYLFFFQFFLLEDCTVRGALKKSAAFMGTYWRQALLRVFAWTITSGLKMVGGLIAFAALNLLCGRIVVGSALSENQMYWLLMLSVMESVGVWASLYAPLLCYELTLFYRVRRLVQETDESEPARDPVTDESEPARDTVTDESEPEQDTATDESEPVRAIAADKIEKTPRKEKPVKKPDRSALFVMAGFTAVCLLVLAFNLGVSTMYTRFFDDLYIVNDSIDVIAHRAGGDLGAENTVAGMEAAAKAGARWSEIDVQRTADGAYIILHDKTFARVAGVSKKPSDMTLSQIRDLTVQDLFDSSRPGQPVPTFEEMADAARGKIGLFIELKGETADRKMADDIVRILREKNMVQDTAILSLDYPLISYVEETYPEINTGYLYYFSFGDISDLKADFLIMEEKEATSDRINEIHSSGKKAIVWTVNTAESAERFASSDVDGIITDYVKMVQEALRSRRDSTQIDRITQFLVNTMEE